jgi:hypothetical protein
VKTLEERFLAKVAPENRGGCRLWTGALNEWGYGTIGYQGKVIKAHRAAWMLARGPIPEGALVLHRCDVPACVSIHHLFLGSSLDNARDMISKGRGRHPTAERNAAKTHCPKGHPYSAGNLYVHAATGKRYCKACSRDSKKRQKGA